MTINLSKLSIIVLFLCSILFAEEYTLEKILELVKDCSDDIAVADLEFAAGKEELKFYQAEAMPNVSFNTGTSYLKQSIKAQSYTASEIIQILDEAKLTHINGITLNWGLSLQQPLVTFGRVLNALKIAQIRRNMLDDVLVLKKDLYYLSVIQAYSTLMSSQKKLAIAEKSLDLADKLLNRMDVEMLTGKGIRRDSLRIQANVYKAESDLLAAQSSHRIAISRMAKLTELTMPYDETSFRYNAFGWASDVPRNSEDAISYQCKVKEYEASILLYNKDYERGKLLPSINLTGGVSNELMIPDTSKIMDKLRTHFMQGGQSGPDTGFTEILPPKYKDYFNHEFFNYSIGLQLTWNIFDGRRSFAKYKQAQINYQKAERELKILREENQEQIEEARSALISLDKMTEASHLQFESIGQAFKQATEDYKNGFIDYTTLLEMEQQLKEVEMGIIGLNMQRLLAVAQYKIALGIPLVK